MTPLKITLVASRGSSARNRESDAGTPSTTTQTSRNRSGARRRSQAPQRSPKSLVAPSAPSGPARPEPAACRPRPGGMLTRLRPRAVRPRSLGTAQAAMSSSCGPLPTTRPSSSTMIRSACMIVLTRWATITTAASPVSRASAARDGRRSRHRAPRNSRRTDRRRTPDERAGDREALALAARRRSCRPGDHGVEPAGHRRDEVLRLGDLEGVPQLLVARLGRPKRRLSATVPLNRYAGWGTIPMRAQRRSSCLVAHVDAVDEHGPAVTSKKRGMRFSSVVLP